jgi:hypothetical protein
MEVERIVFKDESSPFNFGHYPKIEHERFVSQPLSRISRVS